MVSLAQELLMLNDVAVPGLLPRFSVSICAFPYEGVWNRKVPGITAREKQGPKGNEMVTNPNTPRRKVFSHSKE